MAATDGEDWRALLLPGSRTRIVNKITETLTRHVPNHGPDGLEQLRRIATRFEEKTHVAAQSQSDYLRIISLKMITMESKVIGGSNASSGPGGKNVVIDPVHRTPRYHL